MENWCVSVRSGPTEAVAWAFTHGFVAALAEKECDKLVSGKWVWPGYLNYHELGGDLRSLWSRTEVHERPPACPSEQLVRKVMRKDFPHIIEPLGSEWGHCSHCLVLKQRMRAGCKTEAERQQITAEARRHRKQHQAERSLLEERRQLSVEFPYKYLLIVIDGTRNAPVPNKVRQPKVTTCTGNSVVPLY